MLCADCNRELSPVTLMGSGHRIDLDYCGHCGGIWTDTGETNFLDLKSLDTLTELLPEQGANDTLNQERLCPRDHSILIIFRGESIPYDLSVYQCKKCNGFWFPFNTLQRFKAAQKSKLDYLKTWKIPLPSVYSVILPLLILIILGSGLLAVMTGINKETDTRIKASSPISKPLVLHPDSTSVIISFNTKTPVTTKIKYWKQSNSKIESWVSNVPKMDHTVQINDLIPGATYSYQLLVKDSPETESPVYTFTVNE